MIYCKNCKWLKEEIYNDDCEEEIFRSCEKEIERDSSYERYTTKIYMYNEQNKNNNCEYYEKK